MRCTTGMVRAVFLAPRCSRSLSICRVSFPPLPCVLTTLIADAPSKINPLPPDFRWVAQVSLVRPGFLLESVFWREHPGLKSETWATHLIFGTPLENDLVEGILN